MSLCSEVGEEDTDYSVPAESVRRGEVSFGPGLSFPRPIDS